MITEKHSATCPLQFLLKLVSGMCLPLLFIEARFEFAIASAFLRMAMSVDSEGEAFQVRGVHGGDDDLDELGEVVVDSRIAGEDDEHAVDFCSLEILPDLADVTLIDGRTPGVT